MGRYMLALDLGPAALINVHLWGGFIAVASKQHQSITFIDCLVTETL